MDFGFYDGFFAIFPILFILTFALVFGIIISAFVRNARRETKNNASPRLTVNAEIVTKRMSVTNHYSRNTDGVSSTDYYVTFQVESGDRMELEVDGPTYGMMAEGDRGSLTFQGTRFLAFQRN